MDKVFMSEKPLSVKVTEEVPVFERADGGELSQDDTELYAGLGLWEGPDPRQTLTDDMVKAPLNQTQRPDLSNGTHYGLFSVHRDAKGVETLGLKAFKPGQDRLKAFPCTVDMGNDLLTRSIHEADVAAVLMKVSPVVEKVPVLGVVPRLFRRLLKPVILNLLKLEGAMARKTRKLADGVAFFDPKPKPLSLTKSFILRPSPDEGLETFKTSESLLSLFGFTIALYSERLTLGTMLFLASLASCLLNRFN